MKSGHFIAKLRQIKVLMTFVFVALIAINSAVYLSALYSSQVKIAKEYLMYSNLIVSDFGQIDKVHLLPLGYNHKIIGDNGNAKMVFLLKSKDSKKCMINVDMKLEDGHWSVKKHEVSRLCE